MNMLKCKLLMFVQKIHGHNQMLFLILNDLQQLQKIIGVLLIIQIHILLSHFRNIYILLIIQMQYIKIIAYSLKSKTTNAIDNPISWELYGSIDNKTWSLFDKKTNSDCLNNIHVYTTNTTGIGFYKQFKFIQNINSENRHYFCLNKVDFFGTFSNRS